MRLQQRITFARDPNIALHAWNRAVRWAKAETALFVHTRIMPKHFTVAGATEYRMKQRSESYRRFKRRLRGAYYADMPLMKTGRLRRAMVGQHPVITQNRRGIIVRYDGLPAYLAIRGRNRPDMRAELRRLSAIDHHLVLNYLTASLERAVQMYQVGMARRGRGRPRRAAGAS